MANIVTTRDQGSFATNQEQLDYAEGIALLDLNENPFTLMSLKFNTDNTGNMKRSWWQDELVPEHDTVDTTSPCVTAGTTLTVDNGDRFAVGDIWMRMASRETFLVTARSTNELTIVRDYGATSGAYTALADTFQDEDYVTFIGNAFEQGHTTPTSKSTKITSIDNWCQEQRTSFEITEIAEAAALRTGNDWTWQAVKGRTSHSRKLERQHLFGHPMPGDETVFDGTNNTEPSAAGGLMHYLTGGTGFDGCGSDRMVSQTDLTEAEFDTWLEAVFEHGSRDKMLFCAPMFRTGFDKWGKSKMNTFVSAKVYGLGISRWECAHGNLAIVTHRMLKDPGGDDGNYAFAVDMNDISVLYYSHLGSTRRRDLKPYESDGSTKKKAEFQTISCLRVKNPKKHGVLYSVKTIS